MAPPAAASKAPLGGMARSARSCLPAGQTTRTSNGISSGSLVSGGIGANGAIIALPHSKTESLCLREEKLGWRVCSKARGRRSRLGAAKFSRTDEVVPSPPDDGLWASACGCDGMTLLTLSQAPPPCFDLKHHDNHQLFWGVARQQNQA